MSFKSQEQAQNLMRLVKPDRLVLELDESRRHHLIIDERQGRNSKNRNKGGGEFQAAYIEVCRHTLGYMCVLFLL